MNNWMMSAAALLFLTTGVHVFMGGPEIHVVIQESDLVAPVRGVAAVLWHAITVILIVFALACAWLARAPNASLAYLMIAVQMGFVALFIFYGITILGNLTVMPQWIIFLLISALIWQGVRREQKAPLAA